MPQSAPLKPLVKVSAAVRPLGVALFLVGGAGGLGACATNVGDTIPAAVGGLPAGAPERPAEQPLYPAVHDIPPPRPVGMLSDDQQDKLERDLTLARTRQESLNPNAKKPAAGGKQKP